MGMESVSSGSSYMFRMTKHYVFLWDGKVFVDKEQKMKAQSLVSSFFPLGFTTPVWFTASLPSLSFNCHSYKTGIMSSVNILQGDNIHQSPHITTQIPSWEEGRDMKPDGLSTSKLWASFPSSLELEMRIQFSKLYHSLVLFARSGHLRKLVFLKMVLLSTWIKLIYLVF